MMLASCSTSPRALSCVMRQERPAASASPTTKATSITRLNLPFRPIQIPPQALPSRTAGYQLGRLVRSKFAGHRRAQFVLITADRGTGVRTEDSVHLAIIVAKLTQ